MSSSPSNISLPSVGALLKSAWIIFKTRLGVLIALEAIPVALGFVYGFVAETVSTLVQPTGAGGIILVILAVFAVLAIMVVMLWSYVALFCVIKDYRERIGIREAYQSSWKQLSAFVWLNLLIGLVTFGATIPLIIPGIVLGIWFSFALFILVDEKRRGSEALFASREYVRGAWWAVLGRMFFLTLLGLIFVGIIYIPIILTAGQPAAAQNILQFVNLIFSIVWGPFALAYLYSIYQALKKQKGTVQVAVTGGRKVGLVLLTIWGILAMVIVVVGVWLVAGI